MYVFHMGNDRIWQVYRIHMWVIHGYPGFITPLPGIKSYQEPEKNTVFVVFSGGQLHFDLLNTSQLLIILWRRGITQLWRVEILVVFSVEEIPSPTPNPWKTMEVVSQILLALDILTYLNLPRLTANQKSRPLCLSKRAIGAWQQDVADIFSIDRWRNVLFVKLKA